MRRSCDTCYRFVLSQGLFPHYVCLEADTKPDFIAERTKNNGRDCPYWRHKVRIVDNTFRRKR